MTERPPLNEWKSCWCPNCGRSASVQFFPAKRAVVSYCEYCKEYYQIENVSRYHVYDTTGPVIPVEDLTKKGISERKVTPLGEED